MLIQGKNLLVLGSDDVVMPLLTVNITAHEKDKRSDSPLICSVTNIENDYLICELPKLDSTLKYQVSVGYGKLLTQNLGLLSTTTEGLSIETYIGIGVGIGLFAIIVVIIIIVLKCRVTKTNQGMKKLQVKMDNLEMTVAKECKEGRWLSSLNLHLCKRHWV